jgi:hypothetical protein
MTSDIIRPWPMVIHSLKEFIMKGLLFSGLWLCLFMCATVLSGLDQADPGLERDPLMKLQKEGWKIVQDGVLRRELKTNAVETFVFGEAGFSWKLRDLRIQLQVLRKEFQAHPTPELGKAIASHRKLIASTLKMIERARVADARRKSTVSKTGCTPTFAYSAKASYNTDRQGTWAEAIADFNVAAGCNVSGEVYAYAFAKTTVNGAPSTATVTDGPRSGSNVNARAEANRNGGAPCESYAYASVTSDSLSPTSYSISQTNDQCPSSSSFSSSSGICTIDDVPAATLLLPYFEVDLGNATNGVNTQFSINNAAAAAAIAHVTLWTDQSIPTLNFDVYLTGYDRQTLSVRDIFNGTLPRTADRGADASDANSPSPPPGTAQAANVNPFTGPFTPGVSTEFDFGGSSGPCVAAYTNPVLDNFRVTNLRAAHTGQNAPAYGGCLGANYGDNIARGYITVDSVTQCNLLFPSSATYFSGGIADTRNILWGDYYYVNHAQNFAQGETLVHIESCPTPAAGTGGRHCPFAQGSYTFYGRYTAVSGQDQREPLATTFATRFDIAGNTTTDLIVWRDSKTVPTGVNAPYTCGAVNRPAWFPLNQTDVVAFDEQENPQDLCFTGDVASPPIGGAQTCFPLEAQRVSMQGGNVIGSDPTPNAGRGWIYLNLNTTVSGVSYPAANPAITQAWVTTVMGADGRFSVGYDAIKLDSACQPNNVVFIP